MANTLILKRNSTANAAPGTGNLVLGELAVNTVDGRLYTKIDTGSAAIVDLTKTDVTGDATGNRVASTGNIALTLSNTGVVADTYGNAQAIPSLTVDAKGRITSATTFAIDTAGIANGTSNISIPVADGPILVNVDGTANLAIFNLGGVIIDGYANVIGNIHSDGLLSVTGNANVGNLGTGGIYTDNYYYANGAPVDFQQPAGSNTQVQFNDDNDFGASANFTFNSATDVLTVTGNIDTGNLSTTGLIDSTGNVSGGNLVTAGDVTTATVTASGNITGANLDVTSGITAGTTIVSTGNITGGNIGTAGLVSATGNVTGGNLNTSGLVSATGNVTGGNLVTAGVVNATGNVSGGNITTAGDVTTATVTASGNVSGGNLTTAGDVTTATVTASGNISGANVNVTSGITAGTTIVSTGNITGGNLVTAGQVSATGNVNGGNLVTAGNVDGGNINSAKLASSSDLQLISTGGNILIDASGGRIDMGGLEVHNVGTPTDATDAATKQYVDDAVSAGLTIHTPVRVESPDSAGSLNATYAQGGTTYTVNETIAGNTVVFSTAANLQVNDQLWFSTSFQGIVANVAYFVVSAPNTSAAVLSTTYSGVPVANITSASGLTESVRVNSGVGATLTNAGTLAALSVDGVTLSANDRVLVYNQSNGYENGVYVVTTEGDAGNAWVLTRSSDTDTYAPSDINALDAGDYFFVTAGDTGAGESYVMTSPTGPIILGYTDLTFTQFSSSQVYSANTNAGLSLTGTTFAAKVDLDTTAFDAGGNIKVKDGANLVTPNIGDAIGNSLTLSGNGAISATTLVTTGNISGGNLSGTSIVGTLTTAAQPNITSIGNLSLGNIGTLTVSTLANITATTQATSNVTGALIVAGGIGVAKDIWAADIYKNGVVVLNANDNIDGGTY